MLTAQWFVPLKLSFRVQPRLRGTNHCTASVEAGGS